jgi:hypothetical protein
MTAALTIITGAQTGVDTAAIETAIKLQLPYEGWVPHGYTNEAGSIMLNYRASLRETPSQDNAQRTEWNIRDADFVLTVLRGPPERVSGGTAWGVDVARETGREMCFVDLGAGWSDEVDKVRRWLRGSKLEHLRCAINGPRESEEPGVEKEATRLLCQVFGDFQRVKIGAALTPTSTQQA